MHAPSNLGKSSNISYFETFQLKAIIVADSDPLPAIFAPSLSFYEMIIPTLDFPKTFVF